VQDRRAAETSKMAMQWTGNIHRIGDSLQTVAPTTYFNYVAAIKYYPGIVAKVLLLTWV
jgi:hypothetical protein